YVGDFAISRDGSTGVYTAVVASRRIVRVPFDATAGRAKGAMGPVGADASDYAYIDVSPDGKHMVASSSERGQEDIYVIPIGGGPVRQLTNDFARDRAPRWTPDGSGLFFYSDRTGYQLWRVDADGSGLRQITNDRSRSLQYPIPSPDGKFVVAGEWVGRGVMM